MNIHFKLLPVTLLRDTVDLWTLEAHNEIHFVVRWNSIIVSTCKQELQGSLQHVYSGTKATHNKSIHVAAIIFIILLQ